jgi:hypothetical protein
VWFKKRKKEKEEELMSLEEAGGGAVAAAAVEGGDDSNWRSCYLRLRPRPKFHAAKWLGARRPDLAEEWALEEGRRAPWPCVDFTAANHGGGDDGDGAEYLQALLEHAAAAGEDGVPLLDMSALVGGENGDGGGDGSDASSSVQGFDELFAGGGGGGGEAGSSKASSVTDAFGRRGGDAMVPLEGGGGGGAYDGTPSANAPPPTAPNGWAGKVASSGWICALRLPNCGVSIGEWSSIFHVR